MVCALRVTALVLLALISLATASAQTRRVVVVKVDGLQGSVNILQETVGMVQGQAASMETDIKTIKGDVRDLHKRMDGTETLARTLTIF